MDKHWPGLTRHQRRVVALMLRMRLFGQVESMRLLWIQPRWEALRPLHEWLLRHQRVDDLHHAPCCPANHYHRCRLVYQHCTCGAAAAVEEQDDG